LIGHYNDDIKSAEIDKDGGGNGKDQKNRKAPKKRDESSGVKNVRKKSSNKKIKMVANLVCK